MYDSKLALSTMHAWSKRGTPLFQPLSAARHTLLQRRVWPRLEESSGRGQTNRTLLSFLKQTARDWEYPIIRAPRQLAVFVTTSTECLVHLYQTSKTNKVTDTRYTVLKRASDQRMHVVIRYTS